MSAYNDNYNIEMEYQEEDLQEYLDEISQDNQIEIASATASTKTSTITKKQRSWVWEHFTLDENKKKPQCNYCKIYITAAKGSTSGMSSHLRNKHFMAIHKNEKQLILQEALRNTTAKVSINFYCSNILLYLII